MATRNDANDEQDKIFERILNWKSLIIGWQTPLLSGILKMLSVFLFVCVCVCVCLFLAIYRTIFSFACVLYLVIYVNLENVCVFISAFLRIAFVWNVFETDCTHIRFFFHFYKTKWCWINLVFRSRNTWWCFLIFIFLHRIHHNP